MDSEIITIGLDRYTSIVAKWYSIKKRKIKNKLAVFDKSVGLEYISTISSTSGLDYSFKIVNKKKFFLAKIKYEI